MLDQHWKEIVQVFYRLLPLLESYQLSLLYTLFIYLLLIYTHVFLKLKSDACAIQNP